MKNWLIRILFLPFTLIYGLGISLRNFFYSQNLLKGVEFNLPVISVGNLSVGGAGKTPHVEYLIRILKDYVQIATLSRGYKRKTKGFRIANNSDSVTTIGDEPLQFHKKFPGITVSVAENRMFAIPQLMSDNPELQVVLLDDAFQHRSVKPGLNILLTQHRLPFTQDWLMPSGRLREWRSAYRRADIIIVSKCPETVSETERQALIEEINPLPHQEIFFSKYDYEKPYAIFGEEELIIEKDTNVLILCALANADYLSDYVEKVANKVRSLEFADHHFFTTYDMSQMKELFSKWDVDKKIIVTTEKDAARLELHKEYILSNQIPIYVLPTKVQFLGNDQMKFDEKVKDFLLSFQA